MQTSCALAVAVFAGVALAAPAGEIVEQVLALVNGVPVLASDAQLAEIAGLVPPAAGESEAGRRRTVIEALVALELRWQDLQAAGVVLRVRADTERAWATVVERAGGPETVAARLAAAGLEEPLLRELVRRAAVVEAYVAGRFGPFVHPTSEEIERAYREELLPVLPASETPPDLSAVRARLEAVLRERKLVAALEQWTRELEARGEVVRYLR
ncbi:MAG TPA: hypothetical protein P5234_04680 [Thermoanaerobaculaceae bacterium]|nr:hypothetical protein [Thermoanaerobaculaceae bacterium]HRS15527.1 hypothetical protein [Thermoanaerobaculaceae bacterium]